MDHEPIRNWLQLPPGNWPPDHYTLLGLRPGEADAALIEQQVHERMQRVRSYQLTHPELATEAMNCLARALVCLTDPAAKKAYDQAHSPEGAPSSVAATNGSMNPSTGPSAPPGGPSAVPPVSSDAEQTFSDWQTAPPPQRQSGETPSSESTGKETVDNLVLPSLEAADTATDVTPVPPAGSEPPLLEEEFLATFSRRGLGSKAALYYQIAQTRQLLWAWEQVGKYLSRPTRFINRPAEATDLIHHMAVIRQLLPSMAPLLGEAGKPGYLVLALARQQMVVPMLQTLLPSQREALARDWKAGHAVLRSVRQFLRQELRNVRRRRGWRHGLRLLGAGLRNHPGVVVLLLAWITVNLVSPEFRERLPEQVICLLALVGVKIAFWLYSFRPIAIHPPSPVERKVRPPTRRPRTRRQPHSSRV